MNKLFRNSIMLIVFRTLTALSLAIILILISRAFGPEGKGIFAMLYFIPLLAFNLGHLGIGTANTYFISKDKTNAEKILFNSLLEGLFLGIFFIGLFFLIAKIYPALLYGKLDPFYI
jgi:O-antigen/teichoic acid export membrane protein